MDDNATTNDHLHVSEAGDMSKLRVLSKHCEALKGLETCSHIIVLYWLHMRDTLQERAVIRVAPRRREGALEVGVLASRSPTRPNPTAIEVCRLISIQDCTLTILGTPVVDVKPYLPQTDSVPDAEVPERMRRGLVRGC